MEPCGPIPLRQQSTSVTSIFVCNSNLSRIENSFPLTSSVGAFTVQGWLSHSIKLPRFHTWRPGVDGGVLQWPLCCQEHLSLPPSCQMVCSYVARNTRRSIKLDGKGEPRGMKRAKPVRYTAAKLQEKGVLLDIDDLQANQWVAPRICTEHMPPLIMHIRSDSH